MCWRCSPVPVDKVPAQSDESQTVVKSRRFKPDPGGSPLVRQVFKMRIDPFVQRLSYMRIFSGNSEEGRNGTRLVRHAKRVKLTNYCVCKVLATEP